MGIVGERLNLDVNDSKLSNEREVCILGRLSSNELLDDVEYSLLSYRLYFWRNLI